MNLPSSLPTTRQARPRRVTAAPRRAAGMVLVTTLMILIMLTLLAVSMFRGFGLQQKIAGNTREKERSFQVAQNALQYGEWWLTAVTPGTGINCTTPVTVTSVTNMRTCSNTMSAAVTVDPDNWPAEMVYTPTGMQVKTGSATGGVATDGYNSADIVYLKPPQLYVAYLGMSADGKQGLYRVTAAGYGGTDNTRTVLQSVYGVTSQSTDLTQ